MHFLMSPSIARYTIRIAVIYCRLLPRLSVRWLRRGVSPKQKERARQAFMKSAQYAGYVDPVSGRFVKPGNGGSKEEGRKPPEEARDGGGGQEGGEPPDIDPIIRGLLARLPKAGDVWPERQRDLWLELLKGSFKLIYRDAQENKAAD
jgi:hypothetical protein